MSDVMFHWLIAGFSLVAVLHCLGLFLLYESKSDLPNQRLLLINLALVEMLIGFSGALKLTLLITGHLSAIVRLAERFIITLLYTRIRLTILHIIVDRFLDIYLNIRYHLYMSSAKMKILNGCLWLLGIVFAVINAILMHLKGKSMTVKFGACMLLIFDVIIVTAAISSYMFFYSKVKRNQRSESQRNDHNYRAKLKRVRKRFVLPFYIVITYILFNFTSMVTSLVSQYTEAGEKDQLMLASAILEILGFLSDAFVYAFMNKNVWTLVQRAFSENDTRISSAISFSILLQTSVVRGNIGNRDSIRPCVVLSRETQVIHIFSYYPNPYQSYHMFFFVDEYCNKIQF